MGPQPMQEVYSKISFQEFKVLLDDCGYKIVEPAKYDLENPENQGYFGLIGQEALTAKPQEFSVYRTSPTRYGMGEDTIYVKRIQVVPSDQNEEQEFNEFLEGLKNETHPNHRYLFHRQRRCVLAFDIADFTKDFHMNEQLLILSALRVACKSVEDSGMKSTIENYLPTGDGFIMIFPQAVQGCKFAILLAREIDKFNKESLEKEIHFRVGIDFGFVGYFMDFRKNWNYVGDAINDASRVLSTIGSDMDDVIYVSYNVYVELDERYQKSLIPMGRRRDKHGKMYRVFHLNHYLFE